MQDSKTPTTDICLLLEGTYPYVMGGVAQWVHHLTGALKEYTFSLAVILADKKTSYVHKYKVHDNIKEIKNIYLLDFDLPSNSNAGKLPKDAWSNLEKFHACPIGQGKLTSFESLYENYFNQDSRRFSPKKLADAKESWDILMNIYEKEAFDQSFVDYFWTFRFIHNPMFQMLLADLPVARMYHTVSTGYAGLLGVVGKLRNNRPLILTEHGIYTRERRFDICLADWIFETETDSLKVRKSHRRFKELWNRMFVTLSKLCYEYSDCIITLFEANQNYQIQDGGDLSKMKIIPNGIEVDLFKDIPKEPRDDPEELVLGLMGRVVSIKDIKTFIRACKVVSDRIPKLKVYIMGPTDEEQAYYEECVRMIEFLGLTNIIHFTGRIKITDYYPKIDILALTSISEAQPLVILEANSMGIPVVSTDVGACQELLSGRSKEDKALGKSGLIAGVTNSGEIAEAIIKIWSSDELQEQMARAGRARVPRYYNKKDLDAQYREIYKQYLED